MRSKAEIRVIGYVGRDPKAPSIENYPNWLTFSLPVNRKWKDKDGIEQEEVTWYECKTNSEGIAKIVREYVKKGMGLMVEGTPKARAFTTNSGQIEASIEVNITSLDILTYPKDNSGSEDEIQPQSTSSNTRASHSKAAEPIPNVGHLPNKAVAGSRSMKDSLDDEIPF